MHNQSEYSTEQREIIEQLRAGKEVIALSDDEKLLMRALPDQIATPSWGDGGLYITEEDEQEFVRVLFSMGAMGYEAAPILSLVRRVTMFFQMKRDTKDI